MSAFTVAILVGSLRQGSTNRMLAEALIAAAPADVQATIVEGLDQVPFYHEEIDAPNPVPAPAQALRAAIADADAVVIATPEHNGSMSAVIKNAIDWASRPFGQGALVGKPLAVIGTAHGQYGGVWAQNDARKVAGIAGATVIEEPELAVPDSEAAFAAVPPQQNTDLMEKLAALLAALRAA